MPDDALPLSSYQLHDRVEVLINANGTWAPGRVESFEWTLGQQEPEVFVRSTLDSETSWSIRNASDIRPAPTFTSVDEVEKFLNT